MGARSCGRTERDLAAGGAQAHQKGRGLLTVMVVASELGRVRRNGRSPQGCQPRGLVAVRETGLMWANMLRVFQVGKALTSDGAPSSWMRPSRMAWAQVRWPACHLTKASASAVM